MLDNIVKRICEDELVIAVLTGNNPNVYYELGIRDALNKPVILLMHKGEEPAFDVKNREIIVFDEDDPQVAKECRDKLLQQIYLQTGGEYDYRVGESVQSSAGLSEDRGVLMLDIQRRLSQLIDPFITAEDVRSAFMQMPDLAWQADNISAETAGILYALRAHRIYLKEQLHELTTSDVILSILRKLYAEELLREPPMLIDAGCVANWGAELFHARDVHGQIPPEAVEGLRIQLRQSEEYAQKHS
jgi:hypothetical protein